MRVVDRPHPRQPSILDAAIVLDQQPQSTMRLADWTICLEESRRPRRHPRSISATPLHNYKQRLPNYQSVECQRPVLDVAQVEAHGLIPLKVSPTADLPQSRQARLDEQALACLTV